jgi:hypothetical protein
MFASTMVPVFWSGPPRAGVEMDLAGNSANSQLLFSQLYYIPFFAHVLLYIVNN